MLTSNLQGLLQNQSLETILICNVVLCFPHNNIACIHICDGCKRSNVPNVCHMLLSTSLPHEQVHSQTIKISSLPLRAKYRHFRTICEQTVNNSPTDFIFFFFFKMMVIHAWRCDSEQLLSCFSGKFAIISPRISLRDLPWRRNMKMSFRHQVSPWLLSGIFVWPWQKSLIRIDFYYYPQYPCLSDIPFGCTPNKRGRRMMLVLPNQRLS